MKRLLTIATPVFVLGAGVAAFIGLHASKPDPEKVEQETRAFSVFVEPARKEAVTLAVTTQGEVRPRTEISLIPQVTGRVVYVAPNFAEGGIFKKGETLVRIEEADYQRAVVAAQAEVAAAKLELARQEANAAIVAKQWQWDKLEKEEPTELGLRKPQVDEARARLKAAQADLANARLNLARTRISAPFAGHVRAKQVDIGQVVSAGSQIGQVFSTDVVEIRLPLTDTQMGMLGLPVAFNATYGKGPKVKLSATVAGEKRSWRGAITRTDAAIDRSTRLFFAIAEVVDPYGAGADDGFPLPVGLFVSAEIEGRRVDDAYVIPRAGLRANDEVYVVAADNKLEVRQVTVLSAAPEQVILRDGVAEGELVVVSPLATAQDGMAVEPVYREEAARLVTLKTSAAGGGS
ncbi:MAG: efflux RND transporter periplasmic adaptor subunit [Pseudomonadota bacterium]